jgi:hypothetical protein
MLRKTTLPTKTKYRDLFPSDFAIGLNEFHVVVRELEEVLNCPHRAWLLPSLDGFDFFVIHSDALSSDNMPQICH